MDLPIQGETRVIGNPIELFPNLDALFCHSASIHSERVACEIGTNIITYTELNNAASCLATSVLNLASNKSQQAPILLAASRSLSGYIGILGSLKAGVTFIPVNFYWPKQRIFSLLKNTGCKLVIADMAGLEIIADISEDLDCPNIFILPEVDDYVNIKRKWPKIQIVGSLDIAKQKPTVQSSASLEDIAYIFFTSGSTGQPKGVKISNAASINLILEMSDRYHFVKEDRFTQLADFTWDPAIVDMFLAWRCGGCVCCPSSKAALIPDKFIIDKEATIIHIVPSTLRTMKKLGLLKPDRYPLLRYVLVGGEPFHESLALSIHEAAPNANIINIYGSQEYSIFSTFNWNSMLPHKECLNGILPLGVPFPNSGGIILPPDKKEANNEVAASEGELCVTGPQLFSGYFEDDLQTKEVLVTESKFENRVFYRTKDRVRLSDNLNYLGRLDSQVKLAGIRVELGEIEVALKKAAKSETAVALGWPLTESGVAGIVAFISGTVHTTEEIKDSLHSLLPSLLIPKKIFILEEMPRNINGKCDRKALIERLQNSSGESF